MLEHVAGMVARQLLRSAAVRGLSATCVDDAVPDATLCPVAGAVACRLRVYDTALCLLSAHLSSGENEGDELKRNYDYSEIVRRGAFPADVAALDPANALPGQQQDGIAKVLRLLVRARLHPCVRFASPCPAAQELRRACVTGYRRQIVQGVT